MPSYVDHLISDFIALSADVTTPYVSGLAKSVDEHVSGLEYVRRIPSSDPVSIRFQFDRTLVQEDLTVIASIVAAHDGIHPTNETTRVALADLDVTAGHLKVDTYKPKDQSEPVSTHNLCDSTTWWQKAALFSGALDRVDNYDEDGQAPRTVYRAPDGNGGWLQNWIDVQHGKLGSQEDQLVAYHLKVSQNGIMQNVRLHTSTLSGDGIDYDYVCDYARGFVEFRTTPDHTDIITADLYYARESTFAFKPPAGKAWNIDEIKLQSSKDARFKDVQGRNCPVCFLTHAYLLDEATGEITTPVLMPPDGTQNLSLATPRTYKNKWQLIVESNDSYTIEADTAADPWDHQQDINVYKWRYKSVKPLTSYLDDPDIGFPVGVVLEISTHGHQELQGEHAVLTAYIIEVDASQSAT